MLLCTKIKLEITEQEKRTLEFMQAKCRGLYNWWVMKLRDGERWDVYQAKVSLQESKQHDPELEQVYGKLLQEVYFRLDKAMKAFYRRVTAGETPGFPRVRPRHCFFTLVYPAMYIKVQGHTLRLPTGGRGQHKQYPDVLARLTEEAPAKYREVAILRDARGNYYACFVAERPEETAAQTGTIAFDLGIKRLATGTNEAGRIFHVGGFKGTHWYNRQLDRIRSKRDRCKKKSRRYIKLSKVYKRVSEKKRNKQKDSLHKASLLISRKLVASTVVVGDLSVREMAMKERAKGKPNRFKNRAVFNDWMLYTFFQMLTYKCQLYGKELIKIDERDTSKTCSSCGCMQDMPLWKRTYRCENCGLIMDRDENSAQNILVRFFARLAPHTPVI